MSISSPSVPVYYYECSGGRFRLVYHIPPGELERCAPRALADHPDGVDLGCTAPDFDEFEELYGYRPPTAPDALRRAFLAVLSATRDWQRFRGSGFMPAADLERHVEPVDGELRARRMRPEDVEAPPDGAGTVERRVWRTRRAEQHDRMCAALEEMPVDGIDAGQTLRQQKFSKIPMSGGPSAEQVFSRLHEQRKGTP